MPSTFPVKELPSVAKIIINVAIIPAPCAGASVDIDEVRHDPCPEKLST